MSPGLLVALLLAAPSGPAPRPAAADPSTTGSRVELTVRFPPWQFTGTFTLEGAGLSDRGPAVDRGTLTGSGPVERVLTGEHGTLTLRLRGELHAASFPALFGRWQVAGATGAYEGATGGGTFTATDLGTGQGSLLELQTMVGRLQVPRRAATWRPPGAPAVPPTPALRPAGPTPER